MGKTSLTIPLKLHLQQAFFQSQTIKSAIPPMTIAIHICVAFGKQVKTKRSLALFQNFIRRNFKYGGYKSSSSRKKQMTF